MSAIEKKCLIHFSKVSKNFEIFGDEMKFLSIIKLSDCNIRVEGYHKIHRYLYYFKNCNCNTMKSSSILNAMSEQY